MRTITTEKMKCFAAICFSFIMALSLNAQTGGVPLKMSYQAVVRDGTNSLLVNKTVGTRISILQSSATGRVVYKETHSTATNANGLMSIAIGDGRVEQGAMALIDWAQGPFFIKTEIDPSGGDFYTIVSTTQLLTVPFALYAEKAGNGFDGDYESLTNKPTLSNVAVTGEYTDLQGRPNLATVAESGEYADLTGRPDLATVAETGEYADLQGRPTLADVAVSGSYTDLQDKPVLTKVATTGKYADLQGIPTLAEVAIDGDYESLANKPTLAEVAKSGNYKDLLDLPKIPTKVSDLENNSKYLTEEMQKLKLEGRNLSILDKDEKVINMVVLPENPITEGVTDYEQLTNKPMGVNNGDILFWNSGEKKWNALGVGQEGQVLSVSNGRLSWTEPSYIVNTEAYEIGDVFTSGGVPEGIIVKSDKLTRSGLLLSLTEGSSLQWGEAEKLIGATNKNDGESNTSLVAGLDQWNTNYPAFNFSRKGGNTWYLPSVEELKSIAAGIDTINLQLAEIGGAPLSEDYYWTSTERDRKDAFGVTFKAVSITEQDAPIRGEEWQMVVDSVPSQDGQDSLIFISFKILKGGSILALKNTELKVRAVRKLSWSELTSKPIVGKSYKLGDIFYANDQTTPLGIVYQTSENGVHGKVLSIKETEKAIAWSESGEWANSIGAAWVIPTQKEWQDISILKTMLNTILKKNSLQSINSTSAYWSSTVDVNSENAISVTLPYKDEIDAFESASKPKTETALVRAIMEF